MNNVYIINENSDYLMHHGVKGQKWGERRFQNEDGTLTPEGRARYRQYVKDFGEKTAKRLVKSLKSGKNEHQALSREYRRRVGAGFIPLATGIAGGVAGGIASGNLTKHIANSRGNMQVSGIDRSTGLNILSPKKKYDIDKSQVIGTVVGSVLGTAGGMTINKMASDYTPIDTSTDGLQYFYSKMKDYDKSLKEMKKADKQIGK
jgi:hypothetical protein